MPFFFLFNIIISIHSTTSYYSFFIVTVVYVCLFRTMRYKSSNHRYTKIIVTGFSNIHIYA